MTLKALAYLLVTSAKSLAELLQLGGASVVRAGRPGSGERRSGPGWPGSSGTSRCRGVAGRTGFGEPWSGTGRPESGDASRGRGGAAGLRRAAVGAGAAGIRRRELRLGRGVGRARGAVGGWAARAFGRNKRVGSSFLFFYAASASFEPVRQLCRVCGM